MKTQLIYLKEPKLVFGHNQPIEDPRDGLALFGPYESLNPYTIQAGVIGTERGIQLYKEFVTGIQAPIYSTNIQRPTFPGFEAIFEIKWPNEPALTRIISSSEIDRALSLPNLKERTYRVISLFLKKILDVRDSEETKLDIWYIVIPKGIWLKCRPQSKNVNFPPTRLKNITAHNAGQMAITADLENDLEETATFLDSSSDFHNQLKARLLKEKISIPAQIILEPTLQFRDKYKNLEYSNEMKAHLAWTQSSTTYYKLGKLPWKLNEIRNGVCYVGLVFKKFERFDIKGYACSAAQMFLDSGDGTIFKGNIGPWASITPKEYHLKKADAKELLAKVLTSYQLKRDAPPDEIFIHGRASFSIEEWEGFEEAVKDTCSNTKLIGITIRESDKLKLYRDIPGEDCKYVNLRGMSWIVNEKEGFLWTRGFVPSLNTSTSLEIPNPLRIVVDKGEENIEQVLTDILALTKLNYNACIYGDGVPVTLRFSDQVGGILTAIKKLDVQVLPFKYYI